MNDVSGSHNRVQAEVNSALMSMGDAVIPAILPLVKDERLRDSALSILGTSKDPRALAPVVAALDDESEGIVDTAAMQLAMRSQPEALKALDEAFERRNYRAIRGAMSYFVGRGTAGSESVLIDAINKMDPSVHESDVR